MKYVDIKKDFVSRTLDNLKLQDKQQNAELYEVTNLVCLCLGLIAFPKQENLNVNFEIRMNDTNWKYGYLMTNAIDRDKDQDSESQAFLRHMRNAICHGGISQPENETVKNITELEFTDKDRFKVVMKISQLRSFAVDIAELYLA